MSVEELELEAGEEALEELEDEPVPPSRAEMLEAIPPTVVVDPTVDLDAEDPTLTGDLASDGVRHCLSTRRAGGRCLARAMPHSYLCRAHAGLLDSSAGGQALAKKRRKAREEANGEARLGRLGTRGIIAATLAAEATAVEATVRTLIRAAGEGDLQAAKAVIPWLNQGLGMPGETLRQTIEVDSVDGLDRMSTEDLAALVASKRQHLAAVQAMPDELEQTA